jgi:hypothetical protein
LEQQPSGSAAFADVVQKGASPDAMGIVDEIVEASRRMKTKPRGVSKDNPVLRERKKISPLRLSKSLISLKRESATRHLATRVSFLVDRTSRRT